MLRMKNLTRVATRNDKGQFTGKYDIRPLISVDRRTIDSASIALFTLNLVALICLAVLNEGM